MTELDARKLGEILSDMYNRAPHGRQVTMIHLFGIKYADVIITNHLSIKEIVSFSGINPSYVTEVNKGIRLSEFVISKE